MYTKGGGGGLADLELRMWQAYYAKSSVELFRLLVVMLHERTRSES